MTTIAVTAATGQLGRAALENLRLRAPGARLVALARDPARVGPGTEARAFDYSRPDTLAPALAGVDTLAFISSGDFTDRAGQHRNVIAAAQAAGVGRVIYTSILKGAASPLMLAADHMATEAALHASGLKVTILRNGWYTENYTASLGAALAAGSLVGAAGQARLATAARADYAEALAAAAADPTLAGATLELAGDTAFTLAELAAEVARQTGRAIGYTDLPEAAYADLLQSFGLPAGFAAAVADADARAAESGALFDDSHTLSRLIGRPTTPMQASVTAALPG